MAGATRFDRPIESQFINTYVPIPFQEMMQAGAMKQQRYDQGAAAMDQTLSAIEQISAIPDTMDEVFKNQQVQIAQDIQNKYSTKDLSDSFVQRELRTEINTRLDKEKLGRVQQSFMGWQNWNKEEARLIAQDRGTPQTLRTNFTSYDTSKSGVFTDLPEAGLDIRAGLKEFFREIGEEDIGMRDVGMGMVGMKHGRTIEKINTYVDENVDDLLNVPVFDQYLRAIGSPGDREVLKDLLRGEAPKWVTGEARFITKGGPAETDVKFPFSKRGRTGAEVIRRSTKELEKENKEYDIAIEELDAKIKAETDETKKENLETTKRRIASDKRQNERAIKGGKEEAVEKHADEYKASLDSVRKKLSDRGLSDEQILEAIISFASDPKKIKITAVKDVVSTIKAAVPNFFLWLSRATAGVAKSPFVVAQMIAKDPKKLFQVDDTEAFIKEYKETQETFMPISKDEFIDKGYDSNVYDILYNYGRELTKISKAETKTYEEGTAEISSYTKSQPYTFAPPIYQDRGVWYYEDLAGEEQYSALGAILKDARGRFADYATKIPDVKEKEHKNIVEEIDSGKRKLIPESISYRREDDGSLNVRVEAVTHDPQEPDAKDVVLNIKESGQIRDLAEEQLALGNMRGWYDIVSRELYDEALSADYTGPEGHTFNMKDSEGNSFETIVTEEGKTGFRINVIDSKTGEVFIAEYAENKDDLADMIHNIQRGAITGR